MNESRFILHGDPLGVKARENLLTCLSEGLEGALMQRGISLCLVVEYLFPYIAKAVTSCVTAPTFHGGCLLHLLFGLEDIHLTKQVNTYTCRPEIAPANPFQHMDGVVSGKSVHILDLMIEG